MGHLKIVTGGLRLEGKAFVLDSLIASSIKSRTGQPIVMESSKNLTLKSRHKNGSLNSWIFLGKSKLARLGKGVYMLKICILCYFLKMLK